MGHVGKKGRAIPVMSYRLYARNGSTYLDTFWRGRRYRVSLGAKLTKEQQQIAAVDMMRQIQRGGQATVANTTASPGPVVTLQDVLPTYWSQFALHKRVDRRRNEGIINAYLLPFFGERNLCGLKPNDGLAYVAFRLKSGRTSATIRREWNVLMAIINCAVAYDLLDKNRLKVVGPPQGQHRKRIATPEELAALKRYADEEVWNLIALGLMTMLREGTLVRFESSWLTKLEDGWWAMLPGPASPNKSHPSKLPLNDMAAKILLGSGRIGRLQTRWANTNTSGKAFHHACRRAGVVDLHFHDLKHTGMSWLDGLGVSWSVIQLLGGHRREGTSDRYAHTTPERNAQLRAAVCKLEAHLKAILAHAVAQPSVSKIIQRVSG